MNHVATLVHLCSFLMFLSMNKFFDLYVVLNLWSLVIHMCIHLSSYKHNAKRILSVVSKLLCLYLIVIWYKWL